MIISNNSGCGGAALSRRKFGETVKRINTSFPHWFCDNYKKFNDNEDRCPVDQHMLIALAAPRPVYIASAEETFGRTKRRISFHARCGTCIQIIWIRIGSQRTTFGQPTYSWENRVYLRRGKHDVTIYDWEQYLKFADLHFK